jgi:hypothetical protein
MLSQSGQEALEAGAEGGGTAELKLALDYSKVLRGDPEVALNLPPVTQINIDMKPLDGVLLSLKTETPETAFQWDEDEKGRDVEK